MAKVLKPSGLHVTVPGTVLIIRTLPATIMEYWYKTRRYKQVQRATKVHFRARTTTKTRISVGPSSNDDSTNEQQTQQSYFIQQ